MKREEIQKYLIDNSDLKLQAFSSKLYNSKKYVYGVKIPKLRELSKSLTIEEFNMLNILDDISVEEKIICGFIISNQKISYNEFLNYIELFNNGIDSWAITDCVIASLKIIKKYKEDFLPYINKCIENNDEFVCRFGIICLLEYYIEEKYIDYILENVEKMNKEYYYVKMAVAWLISICFIKFRDKTLEYLKKSKLDNFTFNKSLQKITESLRVNEKDKILMKEMKRKK